MGCHRRVVVNSARQQWKIVSPIDLQEQFNIGQRHTCLFNDFAKRAVIHQGRCTRIRQHMHNFWRLIAIVHVDGAGTNLE